MKRRTRRIALALLVAALAALILVRRAPGWHEREHATITALAAPLLAESDLPAFFLEGLPGPAGETAVDPDLFKHPALKHLRHAETPEHYLDLEYFAGRELPRLRYEYLALCGELGVDPTRAGLLPYAIAEWTQRLTQTFVEHRADPSNARIRAKCLVYAGLLAHYAGDLHQPLHTTVHFDGRVSEPGAASPRTGIHMAVDGLLRRMPPDAEAVLADRQAERFDDVWTGIMRHLRASHALVDRVYELEGRYGPKDQPITDDAVRAFAEDRLGASAAFVASLYRTAWAASADLDLPDWFDRAALSPEASDPDRSE